MELDFAKETKKQLVKDLGFLFSWLKEHIKRERDKWRTSRSANGGDGLEFCQTLHLCFSEGC